MYIIRIPLSIEYVFNRSIQKAAFGMEEGNVWLTSL